MDGLQEKAVKRLKRSSPSLILLALATVVFCLATALQPRAAAWSRAPESDSMLGALLGEGRRLFAAQSMEEADVYFHSGYYPSIFDRSLAPKDTRHLQEDEHEAGKEDEHEKEMDFLGRPKDWIERFGRNFMVTEHTHLEGGNEREILPWLELSAALDPQRVETYTVAAYWLRRRLGNVGQAERFLREGLKANPDSHEILYELGSLYYENYKDVERARNFWELALRRWNEKESKSKDPDRLGLERITSHLAIIEEDAGNLEKSLAYLQITLKAAIGKEPVLKHIEEVKQKIAERDKGRGTK